MLIGINAGAQGNVYAYLIYACIDRRTQTLDDRLLGSFLGKLSDRRIGEAGFGQNLADRQADVGGRKMEKEEVMVSKHTLVYTHSVIPSCAHFSHGVGGKSNCVNF